MANWNNKDYINIAKSGYHAKSGAEWCTGTKGNGNCYNHSTDYTGAGTGTGANKFCDARYSDCSVTLYVNWEKDASGGGGGGGGCDYCCQCSCCCYGSCSSGSSGGGCFLAGTKVATINGPKDINKIAVGDMVLTYNEGTGTKEYHKVVKLFAYNPDEIDESLYTLTFDDKSTLQVSSTHRFYIKRNNQALWLPTKELRNGDIVTYENNTTHRIINIRNEELTETVYNLSIDNTHNFYVGDQKILVHNSGIGTSGHTNNNAYK